MHIKVIIFTYFISGSYVDKEYYLCDNETIIVEKYLDLNKKILDQKLMYYLNGDDFVTVLNDGSSLRKPIELFKSNTWSRTDKTYETKLKIKEVSDDVIKFIESTEATIKTTEYIKVNFEEECRSLVNEIIKYESNIYVANKSETFFDGKIILSFNLKEIRIGESSDLTKFNKFKEDVILSLRY